MREASKTGSKLLNTNQMREMEEARKGWDEQHVSASYFLGLQEDGEWKRERIRLKQRWRDRNFTV